MKRIIDRLEAFIAGGRLQLTEAEGKQLLREFGIPVPDGVPARSLEEALAGAEALGYPVVLKGQLREVTHKSDLGLVRLDVPGPEQLKEEYARLSGLCRSLSPQYQILVERRIRFDTEWVLALNDDPVFGKVLMFGLGGIYVEALKDVSFAVCPITRRDALRMIRGLRCAKLLEGVRGTAPVDVERLADLLMLLGGPDGLSQKYGGLIRTVEINPLVPDRSGALLALDAVVTLKAPSAPAAPVPIDMAPLFRPRSVAVVGISDKPGMPAVFLRCSLEAGYSGNVYPVNPHLAGQTLMGQTVYASLRDIPEDLDYVYVAVPARAVPGVLEDAAARHARFVHIISGGFAETGPDGRALEERAAAIARQHGIRLIGPNCMGMVSTAAGLVFTTGIDPAPGGVSLISQSGGIATELLRAGSALGVRFSKALSIGNCADLTAEDFLQYLADDPETTVIGVYAEQIRDGNRFYRLLRRACPNKPVVVIKGGRSEEGAKAAASHTGALSSDYALWRAMCAQTGATLVRTLEEFLNALLSFQNLKPADDDRVLLVSHSGGVVVTSTDLSGDYGLALPKLDQPLQAKLLSLGLPPGANVSNPMDISLGVMAAKSRDGDSISVIGDIFRMVDAHTQFGYYVFYLMADNVVESGGGRTLIDNIFRFAAEWGGYGGSHAGRFVLAANSHTRPELIRQLSAGARAKGVTVFPNINEMLQSIGWLSAYGRWLAEEGGLRHE